MIKLTRVMSFISF